MHHACKLLGGSNVELQELNYIILKRFCKNVRMKFKDRILFNM